MSLRTDFSDVTRELDDLDRLLKRMAQGTTNNTPADDLRKARRTVETVQRKIKDIERDAKRFERASKQ